MPRRPERILLFRSGRHVQAALAALRADSPGCEVTVVATPSASGVLEQAGIDARHRIIYTRTAFFRPWPFATSAAGLRAIRARFDRVCVLWNDPDGFGQSNVDRTALCVSPAGFTAITADGGMQAFRSGSLIAREVGRAMTSIGVRVALELCLFLPARLLRSLRGLRAMVGM